MVQDRYAHLLIRLEDALALFPDEPIWLAIRAQLAQTEHTQWYRRDNMRRRLLAEKEALEQCFAHLEAEECLPSQNLAIRGTATLWDGMPLKMEIIFPYNYPAEPPRLFLIGRAVRKLIGDLLREDGSLPIPTGRDQQWSPDMTADQIVYWGMAWLKENTTVRRC